MRVFCNGSQMVCNCDNSITNKLDEYILFEAEIMVSDLNIGDIELQKYLSALNYKNVTIVFMRDLSEFEEWPRRNMGRWLCREFIRRDYEYDIDLTLLSTMAEECDEAFFAWNEPDWDVFMGILCFLVNDKTCYVYGTNKGKINMINTLDELSQYLVNESGIELEESDLISGNMIDVDILLRYIEFPTDLKNTGLVDIISRAPITLDEKSALFSNLGKKRNLKFEVFNSVEENILHGEAFKKIKHDIRALVDYRGERNIWTELYDRSRSIQAARDGLYSTVRDIYDNKLLVLFTEWYDTDELQLKSDSCGVFPSVNAIERYIENEEYDNDTDEGYYRMEAWDAYDTKWENPRYDYYLYRGKICWFEKLIPKKQEHGNIYFMPEDREFADGGLDLNFPTPYKPGDIVLIDCRPFGPPFHAMILEGRDQGDCCFPNIVFRYPGTDEWSLTSLKHRRLYNNISLHTYEPMLSPLYRLRRVGEDELTEEDDCLLELSQKINGSEKKASEVWNYWHSELDDSLKWEQVKDVFAKI